MYVGPEAALKFYGSNTLAKDILLASSDDPVSARPVAESILSNNRYDPAAYSALAVSSYSEGDMEHFIYYFKKAIECRPYDDQLYYNYLTLLDGVVNGYLIAGDKESAAYAVSYMEEARDNMEALKERTSSLGWKIKDEPVVYLPYEYVNLIKTDKEKVYGKDE
jgi:hypothetical protein